MSSNAFRMHFEETVKQFIDLRDQSLRKAIELSEKPGIIFQKNTVFCVFFCAIQIFLIFQWPLFRQGYKMYPSEIFDKFKETAVTVYSFTAKFVGLLVKNPLATGAAGVSILTAL